MTKPTGHHELPPLELILKIPGVPYETLGRIHAFLAGPHATISLQQHPKYKFGQGDSASGTLQFIVLKDAKFDAEHQTYTMTLGVFLQYQVIEIKCTGSIVERGVTRETHHQQRLVGTYILDTDKLDRFFEQTGLTRKGGLIENAIEEKLL